MYFAFDTFDIESHLTLYDIGSVKGRQKNKQKERKGKEKEREKR